MIIIDIDEIKKDIVLGEQGEFKDGLLQDGATRAMFSVMYIQLLKYSKMIKDPIDKAELLRLSCRALALSSNKNTGNSGNILISFPHRNKNKLIWRHSGGRE